MFPVLTSFLLFSPHLPLAFPFPPIHLFNVGYCTTPLPYSAASKVAFPLDIIPSPIPHLSIQHAVLWVVNLLLPSWLARERWIWYRHRHRHGSVFSCTLASRITNPLHFRLFTSTALIAPICLRIPLLMPFLALFALLCILRVL